ncbi:MAG: TonB-dependent receptor [Pseudomonadota bacterium]
MSKIGLYAGAAAIALAGGAPAAAQADSDEDDMRMDRVMVTSQKREQNLQDVPLSVGVFDGDTLSENLISAVTDLALLDPSVTFTQSTNALNSSIRIRGIGTDVFSSAVEPSVSFVVDGVVLSRQGQAFADLIDIERVEVLRGPQSTLFGKNASAGVISIITKDPSDELEFSGEFVYAELDEFQARATISGPIAEGVGARITGYYKDIGGHISNIFDDREFNGSQSFGVRAKVDFELSETFNFKLIGDYRESEDPCCVWQYREVTSVPLAQAIAPVSPDDENRNVNVNAPILNETDQWGVSGEAQWEAAGHTVTSITSYREWSFANQIDIDSTPSVGVGAGLFGFDINNGMTDLEQVTQELRIESPPDQDFTYVGGLFLYNLDLDRRFERRLCILNLSEDLCPASLPIAPGVAILGALSGFFDGTVNNMNYAVFGQAEWDITDQLTLIGGLRVLRDEVDFTFNHPPEPLPEFAGDTPLGPFEQGAGGFGDTAVTSRFTALYAVTEDVNVYAGYSRGYKGPTVDVAFESNPTTIDPETSNAFEAGIKSTLFDGRVTANLAFFNTDFDDFQAQTFNAAAGEFQLENAGSVRTRGVELDVTALPTEYLTISLSGAYTDAEITDFPIGQCFNPVALDVDCRAPGTLDENGIDIGGTKDLTGGELTNSPDFKFNANARYDIPLGALPFSAFVQGAYRWQDDVQFSLAQNPNTIQEAYGVVDASIGIQDNEGLYTLTIFAKNLANRNFANFLLQDPVSTGTLNIAHYLPKNAERYVGVSLRVDY